MLRSKYFLNNILLIQKSFFNNIFSFSQKKMESAAPEKKELPVPTLEDFLKLDIRIGEITECWKVSIFPQIELIHFF